MMFYDRLKRHSGDATHVPAGGSPCRTPSPKAGMAMPTTTRGSLANGAHGCARCSTAMLRPYILPAVANKKTGRPTARDPRYFSVDTGTSQHRMARHDQSRLACVGWRSSDLPTAIAPRHPIRVARLGSWLKARAKSSARVPKVARRRTRLRSWGAGRAVTSPKCRPDDLPRPRSSHLSQMARQISLVPMGAAHRTPITCHLHCFASSGHPVRVRLSAGWPEVEMAVMWAALPRSGT